MGAILGNKRKCYIGSSATKTWLAGEQSNSFDLNGNLVETSDKSSEWQTFISGIKGATASVTVFADDSSAEQSTAIGALIAGTKVFVCIGESESSGWSFEAFVSSVSETNDNGAVSQRTINLTASGEVASA